MASGATSTHTLRGVFVVFVRELRTYAYPQYFSIDPKEMDRMFGVDWLDYGVRKYIHNSPTQLNHLAEIVCRKSGEIMIWG